MAGAAKEFPQASLFSDGVVLIILDRSQCNLSQENALSAVIIDASGSDGEGIAGIFRFCDSRGNQCFCEVDDKYSRDGSNLCKLSSPVPCYE